MVRDGRGSGDLGKLTMGSPSGPPMLPKFRLLPWPWKADGGRPPLAAGWGIGDGELAGEVIRGLFCGVGRDDVSDWYAALLAIAGEPLTFSDPKLIFGRLEGAGGPPFGIYPDAPAALMVTDGCLLWSITIGGAPPFSAAPLLITGGAAIGGGAVPFVDSLFPC